MLLMLNEVSYSTLHTLILNLQNISVLECVLEQATSLLKGLRHNRLRGVSRGGYLFFISFVNTSLTCCAQPFTGLSLRLAHRMKKKKKSADKVSTLSASEVIALDTWRKSSYTRDASSFPFVYPANLAMTNERQSVAHHLHLFFSFSTKTLLSPMGVLDSSKFDSKATTAL